MNIKTAQPVISREDYFALDNNSNELFLHSIQETLCLREIYENVQF